MDGGAWVTRPECRMNEGRSQEAKGSPTRSQGLRASRLQVSDNIAAWPSLSSLSGQFHVWWCVLLNDKEVEKPKIIRWDWPAEVFSGFEFSKTSSSLLASPNAAADSRPKPHLLNNLCSGQSWKESHVIGEFGEESDQKNTCEEIVLIGSISHLYQPPNQYNGWPWWEEIRLVGQETHWVFIALVIMMTIQILKGSLKQAPRCASC